jgi:hypothetical protein
LEIQQAKTSGAFNDILEKKGRSPVSAPNRNAFLSGITETDARLFGLLTSGF